MKIFILVVGLLELLVGSVLLINPRLMAAYKKANNALLTTARMYGAAASSIGIFAVYIFSNYENSVLHEPFFNCICSISFFSFISNHYFIFFKTDQRFKNCNSSCLILCHYCLLFIKPIVPILSFENDIIKV